MKKTNKMKLVIETPTEVLDKTESECFTEGCQEMLDLFIEASKAWSKALEVSTSEIRQGNYLLAGTRILNTADTLKAYTVCLENLGEMASYAQEKTLKAIINPNK